MKLRILEKAELFMIFLLVGTMIILYRGAFYVQLEHFMQYLSKSFSVSICLFTRLIVATVMYVMFLVVCWIGTVIIHHLSIKFFKLKKQ